LTAELVIHDDGGVLAPHRFLNRLMATGVIQDFVSHDADANCFAPPWTPGSWRAQPIRQAPTYPDQSRLRDVEHRLRQHPPLVSPAKMRRLKAHLAEVADGRAFVLQGGDCAEPFSDAASIHARDTLSLLQQMATMLGIGAALPVIKIGRMAGQFAKPRSSDTETRGGVVLPSYRGDIINGSAFTPEDRMPDPDRMETAYLQSAATLGLLREAFAAEDAAMRKGRPAWNAGTMPSGLAGHYQSVTRRIEEALAAIAARGASDATDHDGWLADFYVSHEALLLPYEQALTRRDPVTGDWFGCSSHLLWIGDRTRQVDEAHIEFLRGVSNPLGMKVGPTQDPDDLRRILDVLNPANESGRITLISRMGADKVGARLTSLVQAVQRSGHSVVWLCDPMHGNTITTKSGIKTRDFETILRETMEFFHVHDAEGTWAGGLHIELTNRNVTECLGGPGRLSEADLTEQYETLCDPRLNVEQSLELTFRVAEELTRRRLAAA
jgi:3-deoxy-7-phosphoheptulonate synthase